MLTESEFTEILGKLALALSQGDLAVALVQRQLVIREGTPQMRGQCLEFVGLVKEKLGDLSGAQQDWIEALSFAEEGTFLRYNLEVDLGSASEKSNNVDESLAWYRDALRTCSQGGEFSGNRALTAFLSLNQGEIPHEDEDLVTSVINKSWRVLGLQESPQLEDLAASIGILSASFSSQLNQIKEQR